MTVENLKILRTDLSRLVDGIKQLKRISGMQGEETEKRNCHLQSEKQDGREKLPVTFRKILHPLCLSLSFVSPNQEEYCLKPVSMIPECLTTSRLRLPATHKDVAPHCCNAHKDCKL